MVALDDLLYARRGTVEPEVMLRVSEDANIGFERCCGSRHSKGSSEVVVR